MYSVFVVDDEIRQREAVIGNVDWQRAGFEVVGGAENGIEAIDLLEKHLTSARIQSTKA